jgi:hypothetical protein
MIDNVEEMVMERILDWKKNNDDKLPEQILYYRNGVSEGSFPQPCFN